MELELVLMILWYLSHVVYHADNLLPLRMGL